MEMEKSQIRDIALMKFRVLIKAAQTVYTPPLLLMGYLRVYVIVTF